MTTRKHKALGKGLGALFGTKNMAPAKETAEPLKNTDTNSSELNHTESKEIEAAGMPESASDTNKAAKTPSSVAKSPSVSKVKAQATEKEQSASVPAKSGAKETAGAAEASLPAKEGAVVRLLALARIRANRYQPRRDFDESSLEELKESILQHGILQPILVRQLPADQGYELIAGERRFRAAKLAGLAEIPALVRPLSDEATSAISLIENLQREDLNAIEEAAAYQNLMQTFSLTQETVSERVGRSRSHIANMVRLLKLEPHVREYLANGSLTVGQARPLLALGDAALQREAADIIMTRECSARQAEELVKKMQKESARPQEEEPVESQAIFLREAEDKLKMFFGTQVRIRAQGKKRRIEIDFSSDDDLNRILESLLERKSKMLEDQKAALRQFSAGSNFTV